jgi:hypothetical protein
MKAKVLVPHASGGRGNLFLVYISIKIRVKIKIKKGGRAA